jgi:hypothetical protein
MIELISILVVSGMGTCAHKLSRYFHKLWKSAKKNIPEKSCDKITFESSMSAEKLFNKLTAGLIVACTVLVSIVYGGLWWLWSQFSLIIAVIFTVGIGVFIIAVVNGGVAPIGDTTADVTGKPGAAISDECTTARVRAYVSKSYIVTRVEQGKPCECYLFCLKQDEKYFTTVLRPTPKSVPILPQLSHEQRSSLQRSPGGGRDIELT